MKTKANLPALAKITALLLCLAYGLYWLVYEPAQTAALDKTPNYRLCYAAEAGDTATVQQLLKQGASPNAYRDEVSGLGDPSLNPAYALTLAVYNNNAGAVAALVRAGANVNVKDPQGMTPLMWTRGDPQIITCLLAHGADVNAQDKYGRTVLQAGVLNPKTKRLLIQAGAH